MYYKLKLEYVKMFYVFIVKIKLEIFGLFVLYKDYNKISVFFINIFVLFID